MKNSPSTQEEPVPAIAGYRLEQEKDGSWSLNETGFAIGVFDSRSEALAACMVLVKRKQADCRPPMENSLVPRLAPLTRG
jgi:hypothetical protein